MDPPIDYPDWRFKNSEWVGYSDGISCPTGTCCCWFGHIPVCTTPSQMHWPWHCDKTTGMLSLPSTTWWDLYWILRKCVGSTAQGSGTSQPWGIGHIQEICTDKHKKTSVQVICSRIVFFACQGILCGLIFDYVLVIHMHIENSIILHFACVISLDSKRKTTWIVLFIKEKENPATSSCN